MKKIKEKELLKINGGGFSVSAGLCIAAGVVFIIGVIDGYVRPLKCH